jgi:hypothetical protein
MTSEDSAGRDIDGKGWQTLHRALQSSYPAA